MVISADNFAVLLPYFHSPCGNLIINIFIIETGRLLQCCKMGLGHGKFVGLQ